jgi:hypothetical protein
METKIIINALRECKKPYTVMLDVSAEMIADRLEELETQNSLLRAEKKFQKTFYAQQPEWISVEERLPEPLTSVLAYDYKNKRIGVFCFANPEDIGVCISHWMPLPEPPKPKEPTFKDVFLKAFPKATILNPAVTIDCCAVFPWLLDEKGCCQMDMTCEECWSQPYFEEEGGEE